MTTWFVDDLFIGGEWVAAQTSDRIDVVNPATKEVWGSVPNADARDVDRAVVAAREAFDAGQWSGLRPSERAEILLHFAKEVEARAGQLARVNTDENGSPISETSGAAANAAGILRYFASLADYLEQDDLRPFPSGIGVSRVVREPIGVCALIAPWNFPINLVVIKLAPALIAGNTVIIKPAPTTPLSIRYIIDAAHAAGVPAGVINLVTGDGQTGAELVEHPGVNKVAFTGSTGVGRRIGEACGRLLRPVTLELGGKSAAIILADTDLDHFESIFLRSCMRNTGQTCYISTRLIVAEEIFEGVLDRVVRVVDESIVGDPHDSATTFGPVANAVQYQSVLAAIETAKQEGAQVLTGGGPMHDLPGYYVQPTVLTGLTHEMTIVREEVFGPVVTVQSFSRIDEAVEMSNATNYGLGGIVFSADEDLAESVARRLDTGSVGVNFFASNHAAPFAGRADSGLGVEYGIEGLEQYVAYKSIHRRAV